MKTANLYAITPAYSPDPVDMHVLCCDYEALDRAIYVAAHDLLKNYGSPVADVWKVTSEGLVHLGAAKAANAPMSWAWAHPAVEDALAGQVAHHLELAAELGDDTTGTPDFREFLAQFSRDPGAAEEDHALHQCHASRP